MQPRISIGKVDALAQMIWPTIMLNNPRAIILRPRCFRILPNRIPDTVPLARRIAFVMPDIVEFPNCFSAINMLRFVGAVLKRSVTVPARIA